MSSWRAGLIVAALWMTFSTNTCEADATADLERQVAALKEKFASEHPGGIEDREWVKARLRLLAGIDEQAHDKLAGVAQGAEWLKAMDVQNTAELKSVVHRWGWITEPEFGVSAAVDAWQLIMHAGSDLAFQREVLDSIEKLSRKGEGDWKTYVYLYDRIASNPLNTSSGGLQRFGSQGRCVADKWEPFPVADPGTLDERRKAMGLEPQAESIAVMTQILCAVEEK